FDDGWFALPAMDRHAVEDAELHRRAAEWWRGQRVARESWLTLDHVQPHLREFHHLVAAGERDHARVLLDELEEPLAAWGCHAVLLAMSHQLGGDDPRRRGRALQGLGRLQEAVAVLPDASIYLDLGDALTAERVATNPFDRGVALTWLGRYDEARATLEGLDAVAELAELERMQGHLRRACELNEQALRLAQSRERPGEVAAALWHLGEALAARGETGEALRHLERALQMAGEMGLRRLQTRAETSLALARLERGELPPSLDLAAVREVGDARGVLWHLALAAGVHSATGHLDAARAGYTEALDLAKELGDPWMEASMQERLGRVAATQGELDAAMAAHQAARDAFHRLGNEHGEQLCLGMLGLHHLQREEDDAALRLLQEALPLARASEDSRALAHLQHALGFVWHRRGDWDMARGSYESALALDSPLVSYKCLIKLGLLPDAPPASTRELLRQGLQQAIQLAALYAPRYHMVLAQLALAQPAAALESMGQALHACSAPGVLATALSELRLLPAETPGYADVLRTVAPEPSPT
ncbi:MAG: tetratricopeptide repeat protein, partial [Candidatus Xenobia bacterium]